MYYSKINHLKTWFLFVSILITVQLAAQPHFTLDANKKGVKISPSHYGVFFEDINHAADGGLYAELIRNRSFEDAATPEYWSLLNIQSAVASISIESGNLLNENQSRALKLKVTNLPNQNSESRLSNPGFWGMNFKSGETYKVSFFAKCDTVFDGELKVSLENEFHSELASTILKGIGQEWQKFTCELVPGSDAKSSSFVIIANSKGTVWLDVVSLFPPTFKNRENGLRPELAQLVADMNPKFLRFPQPF